MFQRSLKYIAWSSTDTRPLCLTLVTEHVRLKSKLYLGRMNNASKKLIKNQSILSVILPSET